jgi:hypothetical protein
MTRRRIYLTDDEWQWLWEYTRTCSNASRPARVVCGWTPISARVKGYKKKVKLNPILDTIQRKWDQWLVRTPDGHTRMGKDLDQIEREVDAYLRRLRRRISRGYTQTTCDLSIRCQVVMVTPSCGLIRPDSLKPIFKPIFVDK